MDTKAAITEFTNELLSNEQFEVFERLDAQKRNRIADVGFAEFIAHGYKGTSTNELVKKAGISKGLLFHYFGSKAGMFKYLLNEAATRLTQDIISNFDLPAGDVFEIISQITLQKIEISLRYPLETDFIIYALKDSLPTELVAYRERFLGYANNYIEVISALIDENLLLNGVTKERAAEIVAWVCQGYADKLIADDKLQSGETEFLAIKADMDSYFKVLRLAIYR